MALAGGSLMASLAGAQVSQIGVDQQSANIVHLTLTEHGLHLSRASVRPGKIQMLIDNQTMMIDPELVVSRARQLGAVETKDALTKVSERRVAKRWWRELTLPPGSYVITLAQAPKFQARFTVSQ
jgi:hypothetical protein